EVAEGHQGRQAGAGQREPGHRYDLEGEPDGVLDQAQRVAEVMLELRGIKKSFGGVKALQGVDFSVAPGEIVGLVGGNGAGKSTLMKISAGAYLPEEGTVTMNGQTPETPADAIGLGVSLVRQELIQAVDLDVGANVML